MRTYTRKRPDYQEIKDVHRLCRLCLGESLDTVPIFTENSENVCAVLALRIMICVGLDITRDDTLPNKICSECCQELDRYYRFRKRCEATYQKLKSHVIAFKERQYKAQLKCNDNVKHGNNHDKFKYFMKFEQVQLPEVNIIPINGVSQHYINEKLPDKSRVTEQVNDEDDSELNISTFLTTMLMQIGIFTPEDNGLTLADESIKTIELETGNGDVITMQLTEEDEQIEVDFDTSQVMESPETANADLMDTPQIMESTPDTTEELNNLEVFDSPPNTEIESDAPKHSMTISIKYITSKNGPMKENLKNTTEGNKKAVPGWSRGRVPWCEQCNKRFASGGALSRHRRVHSGEKPHACRDCGRAFAQREVMLRHRLLHTGERPFKCGSCEKGFTQRGALRAHERAHAPPHERMLALHRCAQCPKVFMHASGLSRHMNDHKGCVYVCGACGRQFRDKSSLLRHMRNTSHAQDTTASSTTVATNVQ